MATPHINASKGDFAKVVLMPGDPLRAKWIAENYLSDVRLVNEVRGALGFTGKGPHGGLVSVMASGMGMPSIGIYSHELFAEFGVESIIRIGTMGTYQPDVGLRSIVLAQGACTDSNWMGQHDLRGGTFSAIADFGLLHKAYLAARKKGLEVHVGNILSADIFYDHDPSTWKKWAGLGVLGVEMEAYGLYANAASMGKKALALLTVTDSFLGAKKLTSEERQLGLGEMVETALLVAESEVGCPILSD